MMFFFGKTRRAAGNSSQSLRDGLQALARSAFPKRCPGCGRIYSSIEQYLKASFRPGAEPREGEGGPIRVDLYRRCACGASLTDCFTDRRDHTESGAERRALFGELVERLTESGVAPEVARSELLTVLAGRPSAVLQVEPVS